jgi:6-phosphogluconolactonase
MNEWRSFTDRAALDSALAAHIADALDADITRRGSAGLALSGGSTPKAMFRRLSQAPLDWSRVYITLVDERWVEPGHQDSNERLLRENLLRERASTANFIALKNREDNADDAVSDIAGSLTALPSPLTLVVLGMGGDGHTASWFPRAANLAELLDRRGEDRVAATDPVTAAHQRMTLTLPAVLDSGEIIIHITGEDKRELIAGAAEHRLPIAAVTEQTATPTTIWWAP